MSGTLQTVHVRVNDKATGKPTPVRLRFAGLDGTYFPPLGRLAEFATDIGVDVGGNLLLCGKQYAFIDGTCEVRLPAGVPLEVEISKGPEYQPLYSSITLAPGKLALRFEIERWIDLRAERWYSGDTQSYFLSPHAALLEAAAEDVAVVNLLAWEYPVANPAWGEETRPHPAIPNILDFSGQRPALEMPGHMVVVNTLNYHRALGSLFLLNCHRIVYPLTAGGPAGVDDWTLADWCDQCHRKGGLVVGDNFCSLPGLPHGELLADLVLGKIDALELTAFENPDAVAQAGLESSLRNWYRLLEAGFAIPLVTGSCKKCNRDVLGCPRTYAQLLPEQDFTYHNWIEAVRAGRSFVSNGPILSLSVDGQGCGSVLTLPAGRDTVHVRAAARSIAPFEHLEVVSNEAVVARAAAAGDPSAAVIEADVPMSAGGWILARCWGPYDAVLQRWLGAMTSPIYVRAGGQAARSDKGVIALFQRHIDKMIEWVGQKEGFAVEHPRQRVAAIFESARKALKARS